MIVARKTRNNPNKIVAGFFSDRYKFEFMPSVTFEIGARNAKDRSSLIMSCPMKAVIKPIINQRLVFAEKIDFMLLNLSCGEVVGLIYVGVCLNPRSAL